MPPCRAVDVADKFNGSNSVHVRLDCPAASSDLSCAEWQADRFAAALLMPAADVRATVRALCGDTLPTWEDVEAKRKARVLDEKLRDLATEVMAKGNFTNVSNEAMRYRLLDLNLVLDASNPQRSLL
ncbi:MAG: hypothetical protein FJ207_04285 [Gemmatimonadetes bacterium]|nr:hypothetical protein [Gemmatimonadota bacterium]